MYPNIGQVSPICRKQSYDKELYLNSDSLIHRCQVLRLINNIKGFLFKKSFHFHFVHLVLYIDANLL